MKESPDPQRATEQERLDERLTLTKTGNDKPGHADDEKGDEGQADIPGPLPRPLPPVQANVRRNDNHGQDRAEQTFREDGERGRNSYQSQAQGRHARAAQPSRLIQTRRGRVPRATWSAEVYQKRLRLGRKRRPTPLLAVRRGRR